MIQNSDAKWTYQAPASTPEEGADASWGFPLAATAGREDRENANTAEEALLPRHHGRPRRTTGFHLQRQSQLLGPLFGAPGEDPASAYGFGHRSTAEAPTHPRRLQISARELPPAPDGGEDAAKPKLHLSLLWHHPQLPSNRLIRRRGGRGGPVNGEVWTGEKRWERGRELSREGVREKVSSGTMLWFQGGGRRSVRGGRESWEVKTEE
jgi:hypothetical protein